MGLAGGVVHYDGNSNSAGTAPADQIKIQNVALPLSNEGSLVRTGYRFIGWNTAANGSGDIYAAGELYSANASVTLYAQWKTVYALWAGAGKPFNGDANYDGVKDGMAWLLGAATPGQNATTLMPPAAANSGNLTVDFKYLKNDKRGAAVLNLQYSNDLGVADPWIRHTIPVPETSGTVGVVAFTITLIDGTDLNQVQATVPASAAGTEGKIFLRLTAEIPVP